MQTDRAALAHGLDALAAAVATVLAGACPTPASAAAAAVGARTTSPRPELGLLSEAVAAGPGPEPYGDAGQAVSSEESEADRDRLIALVELARQGDAEAFGLLYDHYQPQVYRFLWYRTRSVTLAEDLTSETFFRALRSMSGFRWQGRDFGAWLMTIARNITTDHFKASRTRLETTTEDMGLHDSATEGPESAVLASLTHEALLTALTRLAAEQRDCLVMRFLQGMSIAETAAVLARSEGAVKQLQLRAVRNLARLMPDGLAGE